LHPEQIFIYGCPAVSSGRKVHSSKVNLCNTYKAIFLRVDSLSEHALSPEVVCCFLEGIELNKDGA